MDVSAFGVVHKAEGMMPVEKALLPEDPKQRSRRKKQYAAAGAVGTAAAVPFAPTPIDIPDSPHSKDIEASVKRSGTANLSHLRSAAVGDGKRVGNEAHTARLAQRLRDNKFDPKSPVKVARYKSGQMHILEGHHRVRAAEMLNTPDLQNIPTEIVDINRKKPRAVVPLMGRKKFRRDVQRHRTANPALSSQKIDELALQRPGRLGRAWNDVNSSVDFTASANKILANPKVRVAGAATGLAAGGVAAYKNKEKFGKNDDAKAGLATAGGASLGAETYLGIGYGLKERNKSARKAKWSPEQKKAMKEHNAKYATFNRDYFRNYPKSVPGGRTQRALGWGYRGKAGRLGVQSAFIVPAAIAGYAAHEKVQKDYDPDEIINRLKQKINNPGVSEKNRANMQAQIDKLTQIKEGTAAKVSSHTPKAPPKPQTQHVPLKETKPFLLRKPTLTVPVAMIGAAGAAGYAAHKRSA